MANSETEKPSPKNQEFTNWGNFNRSKYHPVYNLSEEILGQVWADPEDLSKLNKTSFFSYTGLIEIDKNGRPLNPHGPTGIEGRGTLGRWGANFAADPIVTRINDKNFLELIVIKRQDCGIWALPGGMVDKGERVTTTLNRELGEEASVNLDFNNATPIYRGYVNDPRNTDNAWIETDAYSLHLSPKEAKIITLKAGDDASDARWMICDKKDLSSLYASHSSFVNLAILDFQQKNNCTVLENGQVILKEKEKYFPQALVIGRFQPFCNHHADILKKVLKTSGARKLLLGLGVSQKQDERNFLDFNERKEMITPILDNFDIAYEIRPITDINDPPNYGKHVESVFPEMNESNTRIFTENPYTSDCFNQHGHNYQVVPTTTTSSIRATEVRQLMIDSSEDWTKLVPDNVAELIKKNNYIDRLKQLKNQDSQK